MKITYVFGTLMALSTSLGRADVIDDFSTDSSGSYNIVKAYNPNGDTAATYATNGSDQFQPTISDVSTIYFLRKNLTLDPGDSVSIDLIDVADNIGDKSIGLALSTSPTAAKNKNEIFLNYSQGNYGFNGTSFSDTPSNPLTLTVSRLADGTDFTATLSGSGFASIDTTFSNADDTLLTPVYFGIGDYTGGVSDGFSTAVFDNLTLTAPTSAPEPATYVLLGLGIAALVIVRRRVASKIAA